MDILHISDSHAESEAMERLDALARQEVGCQVN